MELATPLWRLALLLLLARPCRRYTPAAAHPPACTSLHPSCIHRCRLPCPSRACLLQLIAEFLCHHYMTSTFEQTRLVKRGPNPHTHTQAHNLTANDARYSPRSALLQTHRKMCRHASLCISMPHASHVFMYLCAPCIFCLCVSLCPMHQPASREACTTKRPQDAHTSCGAFS
jgi:hypothetical protein